jgi:hypothetical protein
MLAIGASTLPGYTRLPDLKVFEKRLRVVDAFAAIEPYHSNHDTNMDGSSQCKLTSAQRDFFSANLKQKQVRGYQ